MTGVVQETTSFIYRMLITFIVAVVAIAIVALMVRDNTNTIDVQHALLLDRILLSPDGPWDIDETTSMVYPGVIDSSKFNKAQFDNSFIYPKGYGGARLILQDGATTNEQFVNKDTYSELITIIEAGIANGGRISVHNYPILIVDHDGSNQRNGFLTIEIVTPPRT